MLDDEAAGVRSGTRWIRPTLDDCPTVALTALRLRSNWIAAKARRAQHSASTSPAASAQLLRPPCGDACNKVVYDLAIGYPVPHVRVRG
jgi:hypothetical protein